MVFDVVNKAIRAFRARARRRGYEHCCVYCLRGRYKVVLSRTDCPVETYFCSLEDILVSFTRNYDHMVVGFKHNFPLASSENFLQFSDSPVGVIK